MKFKNLFNIFLILVLVSIGIYFVIGGSYFSTPANNSTFINGNYSFTLVYDTGFTNVTNVTVYNITNDHVVLDYNSTIIGPTKLNSTFQYPFSNTSSITFAINTNTNFTGSEALNVTLTVKITNVSYATFQVQFINLTFFVDNSPPSRLVMFNGSRIDAGLINNDTVQFGFNVSDRYSGNGTYSYYNKPINCTFSINSSDGSIYKNTSILVWNSSKIYWFNVSSTNFDSGYHVWNISCVDYLNQVNSSAQFNYQGGTLTRNGNFTLTDTAGPTTTAPTLSVSSITEGGSVTVTCTGTDIITANPTEYVSVKGPLSGGWPAEEDIGVSPYSYTGTNTVGTYTVRCRSRDTTGNPGEYSTESTFAVTKATGSSQTTGGGAAAGGTTTVTVSTGQTRDLGTIAEGGEGIINAYRASTVTFSIITSSGTAASSHSIVFDEVSYIKGEATVTISSDPITLTLKIGDIKKVDMDSDGTDDLEVNLVSIDENGQVNMKVKDITQAVTPEAEEAGEVTQPTAEVAKGMSWIWWVLIIVVVVVIIALLMPKKKK